MLLKHFIFQLRIQLEELDKKLKYLEELQVKRNKIQDALEISEESLSSLVPIDKKEENIEQDMVGNSQIFSENGEIDKVKDCNRVAYKKCVYNYLLDMKIACSSKNISEYIIYNFKPMKEKIKVQQYVNKTLKRLVDENKIIRIKPKLNWYQIKEE